MPPRLEIVKLAPCMSAEPSLPSRAFFESSPSSWRSRRCPCGRRPDHRHHEPVRRVDRHADVEVRLRISASFSGFSEALNSGCCRSAETRGLDQEGQQRDAVALLLARGVELLAIRSGSVMSASSLMGDVGHVEPGPVQMRPEIFLIRASGRVSTGPNFEKSTAGISGMPMPPDRAGAAAGARCAAAEMALHVLLGDAALLAGALDRGEIDAELAGDAPHRGARMHAARNPGWRSRRPLAPRLARQPAARRPERGRQQAPASDKGRGVGRGAAGAVPLRVALALEEDDR